MPLGRHPDDSAEGDALKAALDEPGGAADAVLPRSGHLAIVLLGWVAAMMSTGVCLSAVSLPSATADLGLSSFVRSASAASTSLAIAATAVAAGVAADRLGRRRVLQWSYLSPPWRAWPSSSFRRERCIWPATSSPASPSG